MKFKKSTIYLLLAITFASACKNKVTMTFDPSIQPPLAEKITYQHKTFDDIRIDDYFWLKDRENPEVVDYLERENDYYQKIMSKSESLQTDLFEEMKSRIKEDDSSVPYFYNDYWYITRFEKGQQYPIYSRKKDSLTAPEEILFDCNKMAEGHDYFSLRGINVSHDNSKVAFGIDTESRRKYTLYVKDLITEELLDTKIINTTASSVWAADNHHLFYTYKNPETLRSESIFRHDILMPNKKDALVFHEEDETFYAYVSSSKSNEYIFITSSSTLTTEYQFLNANTPLEPFSLVQKRIRGLEYSVAQYKDTFYIMTNHNNASNFKLVKTPIESPELANWETFLEHREDTLLEDFDIFESYLVVTERQNGLTRFNIMSWGDEKPYYMPVEGETYSLYSGYNPMFKTTKLRYGFTSLKTPSAVFEYDLENKTTSLLKQAEVLGGKFDSSNYVEERLWATAEDGKRIPISIVYHKNTKPSSETPLLQYAYGSYGSTIDPGFSSSRLSLLDRGFIYAIAHIRGGEYLGRQWYEDGKLFKKKNTFTDFIACSKFLIDENYTSSDHLHAYGGSAGGLLMGVVVNEAPELYNSAIAAVPFVDVITTMLDDTIPLTTFEYDEWGNPNKKDFYEYMKSYSPYDNIKKQSYPNLLVTAGFHDSQVQYWEPAKWVAKLRVMKTDKNILFLDTNMQAGHGGASGRFNALNETAKKFTFLLGLEGITD